MQVPGHGYRIEAGQMRRLMDEGPAIRLYLLHFVQSFLLQIAHTAVANSQARLEQRLCRWLLMCHDRIGSDKLPITHEFLATMLGVRRASVTEAIHLVEGERLIRASRGLVTVLDRASLIERADGLYGRPEAEYRRLIGLTPAENRS